MPDLDTYLSGKMDPPVIVYPDYEAGYWPSAKRKLLNDRTLVDLVTEDDWLSVGYINDLSPGNFVAYLRAVAAEQFPNGTSLNPGNIPDIRLKYQNARVGDPWLTVDGLVVNPYFFGVDKPQIANPTPADHETRLTFQMWFAHDKWTAYFTRAKMALVRHGQFGYDAPKLDGEVQLYTETIMAYDSVSSWYRVNHELRERAALKAYVEADPSVVQAGAQMDAAIAQFAAVVGVAIPAGARSVAGNRFPLSRAAWEGRLPVLKSAAGSASQGAPVDTAAAAKAYREAATLMRFGAGRAITYWFLNLNGQ